MDKLSDSERTTAIGLLRYAKDYFEGFKIISQKVPHGTSWNPVVRLLPLKCYLVGHTMELLLKSFLLSSGISLSNLKDKIQHDLMKCLEMANKNGLKLMDSKETAVIKELNAYYKDKEFEYSKNGAKTIPHLKDIEEVVDKILVLVEQKVMQK